MRGTPATGQTVPPAATAWYDNLPTCQQDASNLRGPEVAKSRLAGECVKPAGAIEQGCRPKSGSKLRALHTLRAVRVWLRDIASFRGFRWPNNPCLSVLIRGLIVRCWLAPLWAPSLWLLAVLASGSLAAHAADVPPPSSALRFSPASSNEFVFDTGSVRGKLRAGGKSMGVSVAQYVPTKTRLDASMGLLSPYRVFSANKRYGTAAWDWPSQAMPRPDGGVEVVWNPAADRPFELRAVYRLTAPAVIDFIATVRAQAPLRGFELFLASYFAEGFTNSLVAVKSEGRERLQEAERESGIWLAFPRDDAAVAWIRDGRWKLEPNPVDWVVMPPLAKPLGVRRSRTDEVEAVLMSPPGDCFAISTPFSSEPHRSVYLSLFGRDLKAGESAQARARLVIRPSRSGQSLDDLYGQFLREPGQGPANKRD